MKIQVTNKYQNKRFLAMLTLVYKGVRVPTKEQITNYMQTGELPKEIK